MYFENKGTFRGQNITKSPDQWKFGAYSTFTDLIGLLQGLLLLSSGIIS